MIDLSEVRAIQTRIAQIQQHFGIPGGVPGMDFQNTLQKAMDKADSKAVHQTDANSVPLAKQQRTQGTQSTPSITADLPPVNATLNELVQTAAQKYHVDPKLVAAVAEVESGGEQSAVSPVGAIGVMQLMPDTAAALGVNPYDEQQNIEGGAKYLHEMLDTFGGDVRKAVAAYNAGPQAVREYGGVPPYSETQNYVNKVLDLYR
jgi:soluble lytic murein transglycosylase-like protein